MRATDPLPPLADGGRYFNSASVSGVGSLSGGSYSGQSELVPVDLPVLDLVKDVTGQTDVDGSGSVTLDDTLTYKITATNAGSMPLTDVVVTR